MITIELIQAGHGDCIWIEYGEDSDTLHRILIDGGTQGTFKHLKKRIEQLKPDERHFDLLVITHIDADHIAGILKLLEDDDLGVSFDDTWFNGYKHLQKPKTKIFGFSLDWLKPKGVKQAELLSDYLEQPDISWNQAFHTQAVCVDDSREFTPLTLSGGMKLTLLSPTKKELSDLEPKWIDEAEKAGLLPDMRLAYQEDLDTSPDKQISIAKATILDIDSMAETPFESDTSLTNGSSIAFLAEYDGKIMLFTGDAYATTLLDSIQRYLPDCEPLYLDLFKIPHHGSDGNISKKLLDRIRCSTYLVSTNGAYHKHPDDIAMARIIKYGGHKPDIYFNYLSKYNEIWNDPSLQKKYRYYTHYPANDQTGVNINF